MVVNDDEAQTIFGKWRDAYSLIDANGYSKDTFARRNDGTACEINDPDATKFCIVGAFRRLTGMNTYTVASALNDVLSKYRRRGGFESVFKFNDGHSTLKHDVLKFIKFVGTFHKGE